MVFVLKQTKQIVLSLRPLLCNLPQFSLEKEEARLLLGRLVLDFEEGQIVKL
jgi:hypothetical protein